MVRKRKKDWRTDVPAARRRERKSVYSARHAYSPGLFFWPLFATASASEAAASVLSEFAHRLVAEDAAWQAPPEPQWATESRIALELSTMRLRDFSGGAGGAATVICAPFALHGATVADFASGQSIVETLRDGGIKRVFVTDWRSATPDMRLLSIDSYIAELNVAVDDVGVPIDLIGLCQGGWLALVYAARFPGKVRRLVLAGAPVDLQAAQSTVSLLAADVPLRKFEELVRLGDGRVIGHRVLDLWGRALPNCDADQVLQIKPAIGAAKFAELEQRFNDWYGWTVDLPGTYYLQVVEWLYKENRIAEGRFVALGRTIDLADIRMPMFLLAGRDDDLVAPEQLLAAASLVGTPRHAIEIVTAPCGHLSLFMGAETLRGTWMQIARWLGRDLGLARAS